MGVSEREGAKEETIRAAEVKMTRIMYKLTTLINSQTKSISTNNDKWCHRRIQVNECGDFYGFFSLSI